MQEDRSQGIFMTKSKLWNASWVLEVPGPLRARMHGKYVIQEESFSVKEDEEQGLSKSVRIPASQYRS